MSPAILVTGAAGFIGMHLCRSLVAAGHDVVGLDWMLERGTWRLKADRLAAITTHAKAGRGRFRFIEADVADPELVGRMQSIEFDRIVHLAAQAGVRYSIENPAAYVHSNLVGTAGILELARQRRCSHLVFASSSSVYGGRQQTPFREDERIDRPASFYAATKAANETMAASYSKLYGLPTTGLRFFTVYGPWGRPDMAPWLFTEAILRNQPIRLFGNGLPLRDFTYIDDIVSGIVRVLDAVPRPGEAPDTAGDAASPPFRVLNIGNRTPCTVIEFLETLEKLLGRDAIRDLQPLPPGDVPVTCAATDRLEALTGFKPATPLGDGLARFVDWFRGYAAI
ncbi:MAG: NAD-dependent epimerase/dehydratase family protein [Lautropia sp.]